MSEKCSICQKEISSWLESNDGSKFCSEECFKKTLPKCSICNKPMDSWTEGEDGRKYCSSKCREKDLPKCNICNKPMDNWIESEDGKKYCSEQCFQMTWPTCDLCGKSMEQWLEIENGKKYCDKQCLEKILPKCQICNKPVNEGYANESTGDFFCSEFCYEKTLPICVVCNKPIYAGIVSSEGLQFCSEKCYHTTLPTCNICNKPMMQWTEAEDGNKYCSENCFIKILPKCVNCGKPMKTWIETEDGYKYCNDVCYELRHQTNANDNAISIDIEAPLTAKELAYLTGLEEKECSCFMEVSNLNGDEALEAIDIFMQSLENNIELPLVILGGLRNANIYTKLASRLGSYNTMRGGVKNYKGFVFEELHAADAAMKGKVIEVLGDNGLADFIVINRDGTKTFVQAKAGYKSANIDFSKYKDQTIVVDKGNKALAEKARKSGLIVEESAIYKQEAEILARAQQLESKLTGRPTAPITANVYSAHKAGLSSAKLAAKVGAGFCIGSNIFDVLDGEKSFSEATIDVVNDSFAISGIAYISGAISTGIGGATTALAGTAVGTAITGAATTAGTAITSTAIGGAIVGGIGTVTTATTSAVAFVAAAPALPVILVTAVAGFAFAGLKKAFLR